VAPSVGGPYGSSIPLNKACAGEVLLAWEMNGRPLPRVHGGPVRVVVPGYIGARSVKWVQSVTAQAQPSDSYFQAEDYRLLPPDAHPGPGRGIALGPLNLTAAILLPGDGARLPAGRTVVTGDALAGEGRSVVRVDVSTDGGRTWAQADVDGAAGPWAWQHWRTSVDLPAGRTEVTARAWDDAGATQPEFPASLWNPGGYGNTAWSRIGVDAA
jgi:sulfite oxidase